MGSLRAAAQMISYEVSIGLIIISVILCGGTMNLLNIIHVQEQLI
jgi:NADH-quinone oxidoreductase subunit H